MRTDEEILARASEIATRDWLGTERVDLLHRLPLERARTLLKADAKLDKWRVLPRDDDSIKKEMHGYMPFAWEKANHRRGISASRSLEHMSAWLWLLGHDEAAEAVLEYDQYGKPWLRAICEAFDWDWRQWDDGRWTNDEQLDGCSPPENVPPLPLKPSADGDTPSTARTETDPGPAVSGQ